MTIQADPVTFRVNVSDALGRADELSTTVWVFLPEQGTFKVPPTVVFAFPGGGYSKAYFHMEIPGARNYSMAEFFAARGYIVVACDHLATGESSLPQPPRSLTWDLMAAANHATVVSVLGELRRNISSVFEHAPSVIVGLGHSMGAGLVTIQQAEYHDFDAVVLLGRAIGGTHIPAPPDAPGEPQRWLEARRQLDEVARESKLVEGYCIQKHRTEWQRYLFYWDDVPEEVVAFDEGLATTFPLEVARNLGGVHGPNARAAAVIDVPIFLGFGQRDVSRDPLLEVSSYRAATNVHLMIVPASAHCHNLASQRIYLWDRIAGWLHLLACTAPTYTAVEPPSITSSLPVT